MSFTSWRARQRPFVAPCTTTLLLAKVEKWRTSALSDFATALATANSDTSRTNIDNPKRFFTEAGNSWQGAAYDWVGEDHIQASKVWAYVDDVVTEVNPAAPTVESYRNVLLAKVNEARSASLTVADNWLVAEKDGVSARVVQSHQDAISGALRPFFDAVATACTKIGEAAEFVRISGDLFGSDIDRPRGSGRLLQPRHGQTRRNRFASTDSRADAGSDPGLVQRTGCSDHGKTERSVFSRFRCRAEGLPVGR
ncbi:hypothetical protein ACWDSJ_08330 [Nocardia sp. NPDC003482]